MSTATLTSSIGVPLPAELPENASDYCTTQPGSDFIVAECVGHELRNDSRGGDALTLGAWRAFIGRVFPMQRELEAKEEKRRKKAEACSVQ